MRRACGGSPARRGSSIPPCAFSILTLDELVLVYMTDNLIKVEPALKKDFVVVFYQKHSQKESRKQYFFLHKTKVPQTTKAELATDAAHCLIDALKNPAPNAHFAACTKSTAVALDRLSSIFLQQLRPSNDTVPPRVQELPARVPNISPRMPEKNTIEPTIDHPSKTTNYALPKSARTHYVSVVNKQKPLQPAHSREWLYQKSAKLLQYQYRMNLR